MKPVMLEGWSRYTSAMILVGLLLLGLLLPACRQKQPVEPQKTPEELEGMAREFVLALADGKYEEARKGFDKKMAQAVPVSALSELWAGIVSQAGAWQKIAGTRFAEEAGYRVVYVTGMFEKGSLDIKVVFDTAGKISGMWLGALESNQYKAPSYADQDLFIEREVIVGQGKWALPGTLTIPTNTQKGDRVPAVVLVHGSGPNDRDETLGPNKPFKDLAWGLASKGIAVLRYEKRTKEHGAQFADSVEGKSITVKEETIDDAVLAVKLLKSTEGIDPDRVFVLGHSLGGTVGPRIMEACEGRDDTSAAGLVMMAAASRDLVDLISEQIEYLANLDGTVDEGESKQIQEVRAAVERIKSGKMAEGEMLLGAPRSYWDDLASYDQVEIAKGLTVPVLVLQGERDYQVTMTDFQGWETALADKPRVVLKTYPALNHLLMSGTGKSSPDEYSVPSNVSEDVVNDIAKWIKGLL